MAPHPFRANGGGLHPQKGRRFPFGQQLGDIDAGMYAHGHPLPMPDVAMTATAVHGRSLRAGDLSIQRRLCVREPVRQRQRRFGRHGVGERFWANAGIAEREAPA